MTPNPNLQIGLVFLFKKSKSLSICFVCLSSNWSTSDWPNLYLIELADLGLKRLEATIVTGRTKLKSLYREFVFEITSYFVR